MNRNFNTASALTVYYQLKNIFVFFLSNVYSLAFFQVSACLAAMQLREHLNFDDVFSNKVESASKDLVNNQSSLSAHLKDNLIDILEGKEKSESGVKYYPNTSDSSIDAQGDSPILSKLAQKEEAIYIEKVKDGSNAEAVSYVESDQNETCVKQELENIETECCESKNLNHKTENNDVRNVNGVSGSLIVNENYGSLKEKTESSQLSKQISNN